MRTGSVRLPICALTLTLLCFAHNASAQRIPALREYTEDGYLVLRYGFFAVDINANVMRDPLKLDYRLYNHFFGNLKGPDDVANCIKQIYTHFWPEKKKPGALLVFIASGDYKKGQFQHVLLWDAAKNDYVPAKGKGIPVEEEIVIFHDPNIFPAGVHKTSGNSTRAIKYHNMSFSLNGLTTDFYRETVDSVNNWENEKVPPKNTTIKSIIHEGTKPGDKGNTFIFRMPVLIIPRGFVIKTDGELGKKEDSNHIALNFRTFIAPKITDYGVPIALRDPGVNSEYVFPIEEKQGVDRYRGAQEEIGGRDVWR